MKRIIGIFAAIVTLAVVASQPAAADEINILGHKRDTRVVAAAVVAGVGSAVAYESIIHWNWRYRSAGYRGAALGLTTLGCMVVAPMIAAAITPERELSNREVGVLMGGCIVPIIGGLIVDAIYDDHPEWERPAWQYPNDAKKGGMKHAKKMKMKSKG